MLKSNLQFFLKLLARCENLSTMMFLNFLWACLYFHGRTDRHTRNCFSFNSITNFKYVTKLRGFGRIRFCTNAKILFLCLLAKDRFS